MKVLKFGGTSVASSSALKQTAAIIKNKSQQDSLVVVVSAMGGVTDLLIKIGTLAANGDDQWRSILQQIEVRHINAVQEMIPVTRQSTLLSVVKRCMNEIEDLAQGIFVLQECTVRTMDHLVSYGEWLSSRMLQALLQEISVRAGWVDSRDLILTDSNYGKSNVDFEQTNKNIREYVANNQDTVLVVPGFISKDSLGRTTTLGRGGSDYTGAIFAGALKVTDLEIWTDVSGMMTADPRLVSSAKILPQISYQEAMELSHFGAKVIYPPTIAPAQKENIPVWIKNTFAPDDPGTVIRDQPGSEESIVCGLSSIASVALLTLEGAGMVGIPGFSKRLFEALALARINVILITQASSEHSICVGVDANKGEDAKTVVDAAFDIEIQKGLVDPLRIEKDLAIVALVGDRMKSHPGISGRMFHAMGRNGVNVRAIAQGSSERNISAVIAARDVRKSMNVLHEEFFENTYKQLNLFIVGVGNVGSRLLAQLEKQRDGLQQQLRLSVRVIGIANSRKMLFSETGVPLNNWKGQLDQQGSEMSLDGFINEMCSRNLRNAIFVDVTASDVVSTVYHQILKNSITVVACNKVACSSAYANYKELKELAREFNVNFLFETNVGAGLPVIGTLNDLVHSGDKIRKIEAVLSGTLNYVFNHYDTSVPFSEVVRQAQAEGYTEPDPRLDLSGTDVMRKILILAREAGEVMEMSDISNETFLPESCMAGDVEQFYQTMLKEEAHFRSLAEKAAKNGCKLKFVAKFEDGKASVGLQHIDPQHDFYHLYGKDNIVRFYTERYPDQPMVVKGAGAGAEVTASGIFADIMRAAR